MAVRVEAEEDADTFEKELKREANKNLSLMAKGRDNDRAAA